MKKYKVAVVGAGVVGAEMVKVLRQRKFPVSELVVMGRSARREELGGETFDVVAAAPEAFDGVRFAFFAGTEGSKGASQQFGWEAVKRGAIVIDNGDDFRMDPRVPLIIPEINGHALKQHQGFIANPNCSTIIALMALGPLHKVARIRRIVAATYQSVSGTGKAAMEELEQQTRAYAAGKPMEVKTYPRQIALNLIPQIGSVKDPAVGHTTEEVKMLNETRKILEDNAIRVCATCVRVPVFLGHSEALNVEFERPLSVAAAREILAKTPGVKLADNMAAGVFPVPIDVAGKDDCLVGRIRVDDSAPNSLVLFVAGDNIRKGAALNAIQIAERMIADGLA